MTRSNVKSVTGFVEGETVPKCSGRGDTRTNIITSVGTLRPVCPLNKYPTQEVFIPDLQSPALLKETAIQIQNASCFSIGVHSCPYLLGIKETGHVTTKRTSRFVSHRDPGSIFEPVRFPRGLHMTCLRDPVLPLLCFSFSPGSFLEQV